jgi:hypothetical protein
MLPITYQIVALMEEFWCAYLRFLTASFTASGVSKLAGLPKTNTSLRCASLPGAAGEGGGEGRHALITDLVLMKVKSLTLRHRPAGELT